jgi:hypothetical protein
MVLCAAGFLFSLNNRRAPIYTYRLMTAQSALTDA